VVEIPYDSSSFFISDDLISETSGKLLFKYHNGEDDAARVLVVLGKQEGTKACTPSFRNAELAKIMLTSDKKIACLIIPALGL
jgi:hypothetical protein